MAMASSYNWLLLVISHTLHLWPFISYNWLFLWDSFHKWGDLLVLLTGTRITRAINSGSSYLGSCCQIGNWNVWKLDVSGLSELGYSMI
jgi:hypothetical protein